MPRSRDTCASLSPACGPPSGGVNTSAGGQLFRPPKIREARELVKTGKSPTYVAWIIRVGRSTLYRALG